MSKQTKYCKRCDSTQSIESFHNHKNSKDGHAFYCKERTKIMGKKHRRTASGIYSLIKGRQTHLRKIGDSRAKPFNMERKRFVNWYESQKLECVYCDIPEECLYLVAEKYGSRWKRLTIDCKDNDLGYVIDNIVLSCDKCNITKNNMLTYEEMLYVGKNFIKPKWEALLRSVKNG